MTEYSTCIECSFVDRNPKVDFHVPLKVEDVTDKPDHPEGHRDLVDDIGRL